MAKIKELWKDIPGYDGFYKVSNKGRIKSLPRRFSPRSLILTHAHNDTGYPIAAISYNRVMKTFTIHRLVAAAFVDNPNGYNEVNHKDGNKKNNHSANLEWCTRSENVKHAFDTGLKFGSKGENHPKSKLTNEQVLQIRQKFRSNIYTQKMLMKEFSVSYSTIQKVLHRQRFLHI